MKEHVLFIDAKDAPALAGIRCVQGIKAAADAGGVWLRGISAAAISDLKLQGLPVSKRYALEGKCLLIPAGKITPVVELPELKWLPIAEYLPVEMPVSAMPPAAHATFGVSLVHSEIVREGAGVLTNLDTLKRYAETAPLVRLQQCRYALAETGEALVLGTPMLPVPGGQLWKNGNVLLPGGYDLDPPLLAALLDNQMNHQEENYLLFNLDSSLQLIPKSAFKPLTRCGVRLN